MVNSTVYGYGSNIIDTEWLFLAEMCRYLSLTLRPVCQYRLQAQGCLHLKSVWTYRYHTNHRRTRVFQLECLD